MYACVDAAVGLFDGRPAFQAPQYLGPQHTFFILIYVTFAMIMMIRIMIRKMRRMIRRRRKD
jgi:hypothetical protein